MMILQPDLDYVFQLNFESLITKNVLFIQIKPWFSRYHQVVFLKW